MSEPNELSTIIQNSILNQDWEALKPYLQNRILMTEILNLDSTPTRVECIQKLIFMGLEPEYLDLFARDLAWKRKILDVNECLNLGASPFWAAVGFALGGDLKLAQEYWNEEFNLGDASWKSPIFSAFYAQNKEALLWMKQKGADLRWLLEIEELSQEPTMIELFIQSQENLNLFDWDLWLNLLLLPIPTQQDYLNPQPLNKTLSETQVELLSLLVQRGYTHPQMILFHQLYPAQLSGDLSLDSLYESSWGLRILIRFMLEIRDPSQIYTYLAKCKSWGVDYEKVLKTPLGHQLFLEELMMTQLELLKFWWLQLFLYGANVQMMALAALKHRRILWMTWIVEQGTIDATTPDFQSALEPYPAAFRNKFGWNL